MPSMSPKLFLNARAFLLIAFFFIVAAPSHTQQSGPSPQASAAQQLPTIEGKWVLSYDYPAGIHKTRIFTFERLRAIGEGRRRE